MRAARARRRAPVRGLTLVGQLETLAGFGVVAGCLLWLLLQGHRFDPQVFFAMRQHGAATIGLIAWVIGLASGRVGLHGGPLSPQPADLLYLLLAPIPAALVLRRQAVRLTLLGGGIGALSGATVAGVSDGRLGGAVTSWLVAGGAAGLALGFWAVTPAMVVSGLRIPRRICLAVATLGLAAGVLDLVAGTESSPLTWLGALALAPLNTAIPPALPALGLCVAAVVAAAGVTIAPRAPLAALAHRAGRAEMTAFLAAELDVRGLLRQREEAPRGGWVPRVPRWFGPIGQRHLRSLFRWPVWRVARVTTVAAAVVLLLFLARAGDPALVFPAAVAGYLVGLDLLEPWWETWERPGLTERLPRSVRWLLVRHVAAAIGVGFAFGLAVAGCVFVLGGSALAVLLLTVPATLGCVLGAALRPAPQVSTWLDRVADNATLASPPGALAPDWGALARAARVFLPTLPALVGMLPAVFGYGVDVAAAGVVAVLATTAVLASLPILRVVP